MSWTSRPPTPTTPSMVVANGATSAMSVKSKCIAPLMTALNATPDGSRCITAASVEPLAEMDPKERRRNGASSEPHDEFAAECLGPKPPPPPLPPSSALAFTASRMFAHDPFDPAEAANDRFAAGWRGGTP